MADDPTAEQLWRSRWTTPGNGVEYGPAVPTRAGADADTKQPVPGASRAGTQFWREGVGWITDKIGPPPATVPDDSATADDQWTVELGGQVFTAAQWRAVQTYAEGKPGEAMPDAARWSGRQHDEAREVAREAVARDLFHKVMTRDTHPYAARWDALDEHVREGWRQWVDDWAELPAVLAWAGRGDR